MKGEWGLFVMASLIADHELLVWGFVSGPHIVQIFNGISGLSFAAPIQSGGTLAAGIAYTVRNSAHKKPAAGRP